MATDLRAMDLMEAGNKVIVMEDLMDVMTEEEEAAPVGMAVMVRLVGRSSLICV